MQTLERTTWPVERWEPPPPLPKVQLWRGYWICPYVPLTLPRYGGLDVVERAWNVYDAQSWNIPETRRLEILEDQIKPNITRWYDILRTDRTPTFARRLQEARRRHDGLVIGITGPKGSGKSFLGEIILPRVIETVPHVIFQYKDLRNEVVSSPPDQPLGIQIDEDLTATGSDSGNLRVHVNNAAQTSRKAELWLNCTGVNLDFEGWGNTLDLRLEPWGYNETFQATRFAMFSRRNNLLGLAAIQRRHLPEDPVFYYSELGSWGEYVARATDYSRRTIATGGVNPGTDRLLQAESRETFAEFVSSHYGKSLPTAKSLEFDYIDLGLPADSVGFMQRVISKVLDDLKRQRADPDGDTGSPPFHDGSQGWLWLRNALQALVSDFRYAEEFAYYFVPDEPAVSYGEVVSIFRPTAQNGDAVLEGSLGKAIRTRRRLLSPQAIGALGEAFIASQLDSSTTASGIEGRPDILVVDPAGRQIALNVKLTLDDHLSKDDETTPEDRWAPDALCILLVPRQRECRLFPITAPKTYLNSRRGSLVAIDGLREGIMRLIQSSSSEKNAHGGENRD